MEQNSKNDYKETTIKYKLRKIHVHNKQGFYAIYFRPAASICFQDWEKSDHRQKLCMFINKHLASYTNILLTSGGGGMMYSPVLFIIG